MHKQSKIWGEAKQVWNGSYSPEEMAKWKKRLDKFTSRKQWRKVAICENVIGVLHYTQGNSQEALRHLSRSLKISRDRGMNKLVAINLHCIGSVQLRMGLREEALKSLEESIPIFKAAGMMGRAGRCLRLIGVIWIGKGRYEKSMAYLNQALGIAEERQDSRLMMLCLCSIGLIHRKQGDKGKAVAYFTRSLEISEKLGDRKWKAFNLRRLGDVCSLEKDYECALRHYGASLAVLKELNSKVVMAATHNEIGKIYLRLKKNRKALTHFQKSHDLAHAIGMRVLVAKTSKNMGRAYGRMGRLDEALEKIDAAVPILKEVRIPDHLRDCYHMKGKFLEQKGDLAGAERNYRAAVKILETLRVGVAGGEEEETAFVEMRGGAYRRLISILLKQGKAAEALQYLERSRLKKLRDQFDQLRPHLENEAQEKAKEREKELKVKIEEARLQLSHEQAKPEESRNAGRIALLEKSLRAKKREYIAYINNLRERFPDLASLLAIQPDALIDLQGLLPPQVAIVQYLMLEESLYIFVVAKKSFVHKEVRVAQADLEKKIEHIRAVLSTPPMGITRGLVKTRPRNRNEKTSAAVFRKVSQELYEILIKPVEKELSLFRIIGIIPNGRLHLLPFQTLGERRSNGKFRFLVQDRSLFHLNSQSILKFAQKQAKKIGDKGRLIAFGNPDNSLNFAEQEIKLIQNLFSESKIFLRGDASEDKVKSGLAGFNILHLATHAKLNADIKKSYILLARSSDGKEDGKLYLREIWGLPLRGYQLVTLSACETAKGKEASGDIMVSLETAFLRAGTPAILASLWEVDDEATGIMMRSFYKYLQGKGKAEALRAAQEELMKTPKYASPFYWAPFILVGDWR
jgi:CHAT domain-containing protein/predicted negative regulator of RcsB-dependent stress response